MNISRNRIVHSIFSICNFPAFLAVYQGIAPAILFLSFMWGHTCFITDIQITEQTQQKYGHFDNNLRQRLCIFIFWGNNNTDTLIRFFVNYIYTTMNKIILKFMCPNFFMRSAKAIKKRNGQLENGQWGTDCIGYP